MVTPQVQATSTHGLTPKQDRKPDRGHDTQHAGGVCDSQRICFFAPDIAEIAQRRRIKGFRAAGCAVMSVSFAKRDGQLCYDPDWRNISLGDIENRHLLKRLWILFLAMPWIFFHRARLMHTDVFIARNLDMLCLAWLTRLICLSRATLVYECLDIHGMFTRPGMMSALFRWVERQLLKRIDALIISSPDFLNAYFRARQGYRGKWHLVENKLWFDCAPPKRTPPARQPHTPRAARPVTIGWVGTIRCEPSFKLLLETAKRLQGKVHIEIHGLIHRHAVQNFDSRIAKLGNVSYHGTYEYPHGLGQVYERLDMVWAQDLWQAGANSKWLLPNRIYEASWFGCPSIALASTQTGQYIEAQGLGWTLSEATSDRLVQLIERCQPEDLQAAKTRLLDMPDGAFRLFPEDYHRLSDRLEPRARPHMRHSRAET